MYYEYQPISEADLRLMRRIDELHLELPFAGTRMLRDLLRAEGFEVGRKHMTTLMRRMGITALYRKPNTSKKAPGQAIHPYLLRTLAITRANHVWAMDISYIPMARGFVYLAAVIDWHSRKVLAWRLSISMDTAFCTEAVEEAIARYGKPEIFNTDQGSQFTSSEFIGLLHGHGIRISMDGKGCWRDNVFIERVALDQVRGGVPACLRDRERRPRGHRSLHRLLQHAPAALEPRSPNPGRGVLRIAASAYGRRSLTPQGPLKNHRNLFRSTGPALSIGRPPMREQAVKNDWTVPPRP